MKVKVNGVERDANELEIEMISIIRSMSKKLHEAAGFARHWVKEIPEAAADFETNAEYSYYLNQYGITR